jgi:hypothetical protein
MLFHRSLRLLPLSHTSTSLTPHFAFCVHQLPRAGAPGSPRRPTDTLKTEPLATVLRSSPPSLFPLLILCFQSNQA